MELVVVKNGVVEMRLAMEVGRVKITVELVMEMMEDAVERVAVVFVIAMVALMVIWEMEMEARMW